MVFACPSLYISHNHIHLIELEHYLDNICENRPKPINWEFF